MIRTPAIVCRALAPLLFAFLASATQVHALNNNAPRPDRGGVTCPKSPADAAADPRVKDNPLLASIRDKSLAELPAFLCQLDGLADIPLTRGIAPPGSSPPPTPDQLTAIRANPAIAAIYLRSPDAMLELLRRMMDAAAKGNHR